MNTKDWINPIKPVHIECIDPQAIYTTLHQRDFHYQAATIRQSIQLNDTDKTLSLPPACLTLGSIPTKDSSPTQSAPVNKHHFALHLKPSISSISHYQWTCVTHISPGFLIPTRSGFKKTCFDVENYLKTYVTDLMGEKPRPPHAHLWTFFPTRNRAFSVDHRIIVQIEAFRGYALTLRSCDPYPLTFDKDSAGQKDSKKFSSLLENIAELLEDLLLWISDQSIATWERPQTIFWQIPKN